MARNFDKWVFSVLMHEEFIDNERRKIDN